MVEKAIAELESLSKQGETYTNDQGSYGWRNPIRSDTGRILQAVVAASAPKRMLEIGTAHGLSALYLIQGTDKQNCQLHTIEFDENVAGQSQELMDRLNLPVKVLAGEAMQIIESLTGIYDLVFFDAQKSHYGKQIDFLWERGLIGSQTVILADNVLDRADEVTDFIDWFKSRGINYTIIPTECGLLVSSL
ncbi:MAG: O-methyltransferase [Bacteroidota bacterium]|jgi:predicted O-methyltransferase YrrM